jgi:hypothetical protein
MNRPRICTDVTDEHGLKIKISVVIRSIRGNPWFIPKAHTGCNRLHAQACRSMHRQRFLYDQRGHSCESRSIIENMFYFCGMLRFMVTAA